MGIDISLVMVIKWLSGLMCAYVMKIIDIERIYYENQRATGSVNAYVVKIDNMGLMMMVCISLDGVVSDERVWWAANKAVYMVRVYYL